VLQYNDYCIAIQGNYQEKLCYTQERECNNIIHMEAMSHGLEQLILDYPIPKKLKKK
jgi:hypothetical protein